MSSNSDHRSDPSQRRDDDEYRARIDRILHPPKEETPQGGSRQNSMKRKATCQELTAMLTKLGCPPLPKDHPVYSEGPSIIFVSHSPQSQAKGSTSLLGNSPSGSGSTIKYFEVNSSGALWAADFVAPRTRADIYLYAAASWSESPDDLAAAMKECHPLEWHIHRIYADVREGIESELKGLSQSDTSYQRKLKALTTCLTALSAEPETGALHWLSNMTISEFEQRIVPAVEKWFAQEPDWNWEEDYFPIAVTAGDAAYKFFREMSFGDLKTLGIEIIEGQCPGNDYYAAELRRGIDAANRSAKAAGLPVRFRKSGM